MRLQNPKEFARLILNDTLHWPMDTIQATLDSLETVTVTLENKFPIYVVYLTVKPDDKGDVLFFEDLYGYDEAIREELND